MNTSSLPRTAFAVLACLVLPVSAQLPEQSGAWRETDLGSLAVGVRFQDINRDVKDGNKNLSLDAPRAVVVAQTPLLPGVSPWVEAGWHEPELGPDSSVDGGFTWGAGVALRPWLWALRADPETGPREWLALASTLSIRGGESDIDDGEVDWTLVEAKLGAEWRNVLLPGEAGPLGATGMTAGAGLNWNSLSADTPGFDGSEDNNLGVYAFTTFEFGPSTFVGVEVDWFGGGDRMLGLLAGARF